MDSDTVEIELAELRCLVEGCRNDCDGPHDRNGMCSECADQAEHQEREERSREVHGG